ncbi:MAG: ABC transporter ATP-binding protein [Bacillota bacterium]
MAKLVLELTSVTKTFPGVVANDDISLTITEGSIHAICGENGAGKSTLMKTLYGLHQPDAGSIKVRGETVRIDGPGRAVALGIGMVHQHFMLIPRLSVMENIILGYEGARLGILDYQRAQREISELCARYGFKLDPARLVSQLSVGEQQRVEILKVLFRGADILILDEPTAVLVPQEVRDLFRNLRELKTQGKTIIFISHKLDEVMEIADRITVLRRGKTIGTVEVKDTNQRQLAEMMVGRPVFMELNRDEREPGPVMLEVRDLRVQGEAGHQALSGLSLQIRAGEVYGIAGVEGNGQTELVNAIIGQQPIQAGVIRMKDQSVVGRRTREIRQLGVAYIPEDRHAQGLVLGMSIWENSVLGYHLDRQFRNGCIQNREAARRYAEELIEHFDVRTSSAEIPALALSGGNQQKVILAREFTPDPDLIVASQPTRGLDVGAAEFVRQQILAMRDRGKAVLLVSADLEEILSLSDRIGVIYGGRIVAEVPGKEATADQLGLYMTGSKPGKEAATP